MSVSSPSLARVMRGKLCSGCGLCAAIAPEAITMAMQPPGWLRPHQSAPLTPAQENAIATACPGLRIEMTGYGDPLWGPALEVGTGHATDAGLRHRASSGGLISALLTHALATGLVDFVVQTGADPDLPTANRTRISDSAAAIMAAAGSRYAPSSPLAALEDWLARPGRFALVGKPCDIAALRARARQDPRIDARIPLMLAFFCAGVPSATGTQRILDRLDVAPEEVASFRYRGDGWPGYATATLKDGSTRRMSYSDSWGQILSKHVQFRCKICPDAVGGAADLACADAWFGDERGYPSFEEQEGRSLVIARTPTGRALLDSARAAGVLHTEPLPMADIIRMQPHQARRKRQIVSRLAAMAVAGKPVPRFKGLGLAAAARAEPLRGHARSFAGLLRRYLLNKVDEAR
jgi:coenzyme F420 hydrogenase subunit beta